MKQQTIGLLQGNGSDLVGGGSIQLEYNLWADSQDDILLTNLVYSPDSLNYYDTITAHDRTLTRVQEFNENSPMTLFGMDNLIILTYPFKKNNEWDKTIADFYIKMLKYRKEHNLWTGVICYDYLEEVVLANVGAAYTELYELVNVIWCNNKDNPLVGYLRSHKVETEFLLECPQFMSEYLHEWLPFDKKFKNQILYQGRSLPWKGWRETLPIKNELAKCGLEMNIAYNGITDFDNLPKHIHYEGFNGLAEKGFSDKIKDIEIGEYYSPASGNQLSSETMFGIFPTKLNPNNNFFPEYAFIDFIRNGSIVILPCWFFEGSKFIEGPVNHNIIKGRPEEVGMISWDPNNYENLKNQIEMLKNNEILYNDYRNRAYAYMMKYHNANDKIRKFIGIGEM